MLHRTWREFLACLGGFFSQLHTFTGDPIPLREYATVCNTKVALTNRRALDIFLLKAIILIPNKVLLFGVAA
jgi:hypothetical protein